MRILQPVDNGDADRRRSSTVWQVRWQRFFEDLEDQLDSEWEAERAALDTEAERLRLARLRLRDRLLVVLGDAGTAAPVLELSDGTTVAGRLTGVGADWVVVAEQTRRADGVLVPLSAITAIGLAHADVLRSARADAAAPPSRLAERMSFGFVLRDLVRKRAAVTVAVAGRQLSGTIDRAGDDHLDLALHEPGAPRRTDLVTGYRMIPYGAVLSVRWDAAVTPA